MYIHRYTYKWNSYIHIIHIRKIPSILHRLYAKVFSPRLAMQVCAKEAPAREARFKEASIYIYIYIYVYIYI